MSDEEIDRMYGIEPMPQGRAYALMIGASLALWAVIFWIAWAII